MQSSRWGSGVRVTSGEFKVPCGALGKLQQARIKAKWTSLPTGVNSSRVYTRAESNSPGISQKAAYDISQNKADEELTAARLKLPSASAFTLTKGWRPR
jgi:hypothetical protein